ncbi:MAG TPA: hypothetical protein VGF30_08850 [Bacteroidia bacterium]
MKRLIILTMLCGAIITSPIFVKANPAISVLTKNFQDEGIQYILVLEKIFQKEEYPKVEMILKENAAPFQVISVDYENKSMVIKMTRKAIFDEVKESIDKLGLRIIKESLVK